MNVIIVITRMFVDDYDEWAEVWRYDESKYREMLGPEWIIRNAKREQWQIIAFDGKKYREDKDNIESEIASIVEETKSDCDALVLIVFHVGGGSLDAINYYTNELEKASGNKARVLPYGFGIVEKDNFEAKPGKDKPTLIRAILNKDKGIANIIKGFLNEIPVSNRIVVGPISPLIEQLSGIVHKVLANIDLLILKLEILRDELDPQEKRQLIKEIAEMCLDLNAQNIVNRLACELSLNNNQEEAEKILWGNEGIDATLIASIRNRIRDDSDNLLCDLRSWRNKAVKRLEQWLWDHNPDEEKNRNSKI